MILSDIEVTTRLESPLNLINRLQRLNSSTTKQTGMELFGINKQHDESSAVLSDDSIKSILESIKDNDSSLEELIPDNAAKIKLGIVKSKALDVLHDSLEMLGNNLGNVSKIEKLATIARDMKNILSDDDDSKHKGNTNIVVYKPITNEISKYDTIVVGE